MSFLSCASTEVGQGQDLRPTTVASAAICLLSQSFPLNTTLQLQAPIPATQTSQHSMLRQNPAYLIKTCQLDAKDTI